MQTFYTRTLTSVLTFCLIGLSFQTQAQSCVETTSGGTFCSPRSGFYFGEILPNNGETWTDVNPYDPGMYFRMPVLEGGCYSISTCPTSYDTQIELYEGAETTTPFLYRDDNGPICTGTRSSVTFQASFTDYVRPDISRYNCQPGGGNPATSAVVQVRQNNNLAFTSSSADMCEGETRTLTAVPAPVTETPQVGSGNTGTFSGTGVSGNVFTAPASGLASQTYTLTYTFGYLSTTQDITVYSPATIADAGEDQIVCTDNAILNGSYPTIGTGQWTLIAGSGTISNPDTNVTGITGLLLDVPTFAVWTISNGACAITMDTVEILRQATSNPTITCPGTQNAAADASCDNLLTDYTSMAVTSDGCGTITVTQSPSPGTALSTGTTEVTLIATDLNGNSDTCSFDVVNLPPSITGFTNRSNHGLTVNWSSDTLAAGGVFVIRYHVFGNSPNFSYKIVPIESATSAYVNGLDENTRYVFRVGTRCTSETMALYSDTSSVWTRNLCEQPTGMYSAVDTAGWTSVTLGWNDMGADTYKVKMRPEGGIWDYRNTTGLFAGFPTMTGTNYEWKVRSICNDGGNRPYGPLQIFSTPSVRLAAAQPRGFLVYPNPSNGLVTIQYAGSDEMGAIRLTDIMGRVVFTEQVQLGANFNRSIDFNVNPGTYILQIIENDQVSTAKLDIR